MTKFSNSLSLTPPGKELNLADCTLWVPDNTSKVYSGKDGSAGHAAVCAGGTYLLIVVHDPNLLKIDDAGMRQALDNLIKDKKYVLANRRPWSMPGSRFAVQSDLLKRTDYPTHTSGLIRGWVSGEYAYCLAVSGTKSWFASPEATKYCNAIKLKTTDGEHRH